MATAQNGTSGVLADGKHPRRGAAGATLRTGSDLGHSSTTEVPWPVHFSGPLCVSSVNFASPVSPDDGRWRLHRLAGDMEGSSNHMACPQCKALDAPILIVNGTGEHPGDVTLLCRCCNIEWVSKQRDCIWAS